jgi:hypothetical protein
MSQLFVRHEGTLRDEGTKGRPTKRDVVGRSTERECPCRTVVGRSKKATAHEESPRAKRWRLRQNARYGITEGSEIQSIGSLLGDG